MGAETFNIIQDTREQTPWKFTDKSVGEVVIKKLDYGDYAVEGYEDILWIERKACPAELAENMFAERFKKLLDNVDGYKLKYIICEFPIEQLYNYPYQNGLPKKIIRKIRVSGKMIISYLARLSIERGIHVIYAGNPKCAQIYATSIMKNMLRMYGN